MTPEEVDRTISFVVEHSAHFSAQMEQIRVQSAKVSVHLEQLAVGLKDLRESTARFQAWATEVVAIESTRLDRHDQLHQDALDFQRQALHLLHRILDKM